MSFYWYMNTPRTSSLEIRNQSDYILGYRGSTFMEDFKPEMVYAPYIPLFITPPIPTRWQRFKIWYVSKFTKRGRFASYISPVIKNMSENVCLPDLTQVQPMNVPSECVFYMDFVKVKPSRWQNFKTDVKIWLLLFKLWLSTVFSRFKF